MASTLGSYERKRTTGTVKPQITFKYEIFELKFCKHCTFGKQSRHKFKANNHFSKGVLDYVHLDVLGPSPRVSFQGASYFVIFIDDFSRKVWVYVLKKKADVFNTFKQLRVMVEKRTSRKIKCLRTDNEGEFTFLEFEKYCKECRIIRHKTTVYTP